MKESDNIKKELEQLSPWLHQLKSVEKNVEKQPPANYFNHLEDRLMSRIQEEEALVKNNNTAKVEQSWWSKLLKRLWQPQYATGIGVVAVVLVLFTVDFGSNNNELATADSNTLLAGLSIEETTAYVLDNIQEFETTEITALVEEELINETITEELPETIPTVTTPKTNTIEKALEELEEEGEFLDELTEEEIESLDIF